METQKLTESLPDSLKERTVTVRAHWVEIDRQYYVEMSLYIGKVRAVYYFYDAGTSKTDPNKYKVKSDLPGIKPDLGRFATEEEAQKKCESVANTFLNILQYVNE